ncbi:hypothetical protein [Erythrobacter sp. MTPC3]|uniref:hypothetical protein n=1 Tax=Erythrobacter sp. MTPC3 TaxID=3056564 RepID=UPI0036F1D224
MQIVRTIIWVLIFAMIVIFSAFNWTGTEITLWDGIIWETKLPAVVVISFLLGLLPMWLYHRSVKWSLNRRIRSLENSVKSNALSRRHDPASSSQVSATPAAFPAVDKPVDSPAKTGDTLTPGSSETTGA